MVGDIKVSDVEKFLISLKNYKCPACGSTYFQVLSFDGGKTAALRETMEVHFQQMGEGGPFVIAPSPVFRNMPAITVQVICQNCGFVSNHNYAFLTRKIYKNGE